MASGPRPQWFLVRPDNTITPLIAVDELPPNIHILGVPAVMDLVDTKSMESVGLRERSVGTYHVHRVPAAGPPIDRTDWEEHARPSSRQGSSDLFVRSVSPSEIKSEGGSVNGANEATPDSPQTEPLHPSVIKATHDQAPETSETDFNHTQDEEAAHVEQWRQHVETPDETQQGCLYKHEMPDDATLRAIGIRALPSWYIAAHPEKARERGWASTSHPTVGNDGFAPLKPSAVVVRGGSMQERQPKAPPIPFNPEPGHQQAPRRMFTRTAREGGSAGSRALERSSMTQEAAKEVVRKVAKQRNTSEVTFRQHCQAHADKIFGRDNLTEDNKKKSSRSPEDKPKAKRTVKERNPSIERLLDYEN
ncbi:MAG: hypothetical protein Q9168_000217 [Polycauliona sp. 1 TL-2023]